MQCLCIAILPATRSGCGVYCVSFSFISGTINPNYLQTNEKISDCATVLTLICEVGALRWVWDGVGALGLLHLRFAREGCWEEQKIIAVARKKIKSVCFNL